MTMLDSKGATGEVRAVSTPSAKSDYAPTGDTHDDIVLPGEKSGKDDSDYWDEAPF